MSSFRSHRGSTDADQQDWLHAVEDAVRGERPRAMPPRGPRRLSPVSQDMADGPEKPVRVWDVWKPHVLPVACLGLAGFLVVAGILTGLSWFRSSVSEPSQQATFDALWGAHRRGDDIGAPEAIDEPSADESGAESTTESPSPAPEPVPESQPSNDPPADPG